MNKIFKYFCGGLVAMQPLDWCAANEVKIYAFNIQEYVTVDTIPEETDLSCDSVMQHDEDVIGEVFVQPLSDNVDRSGMSIPQNVLQPKSDKLQRNPKDKKTKNKQEKQQKQQKKAEERQKKIIEKAKKKEVIQQQKEKRVIHDKKKTDKKDGLEQDIKRYQYQTKPSSISLEVSRTEEIMEEIKHEDIYQEQSETTESSGHKLIHFLIVIGALWIIWKVILRGWNRRCKKCGKWWALQITDRNLIDSWEEDKLVTLHKKNSKGEIIGTQEALRRVKKNRYKVYWKCKHCGQEYTSTKTITIGG